jgi:hypothetical protein
VEEVMTKKKEFDVLAYMDERIFVLTKEADAIRVAVKEWGLGPEVDVKRALAGYENAITVYKNFKKRKMESGSEG